MELAGAARMLKSDDVMHKARKQEIDFGHSTSEASDIEETESMTVTIRGDEISDAGETVTEERNRNKAVHIDYSRETLFDALKIEAIDFTTRKRENLYAKCENVLAPLDNDMCTHQLDYYRGTVSAGYSTELLEEFSCLVIGEGFSTFVSLVYLFTSDQIPAMGNDRVE